MTMASHTAALDAMIARMSERVQLVPPGRVVGRVVESLGPVLSAVIPSGFVGEVCDFVDPAGTRIGRGEIIQFREQTVTLAAYGTIARVSAQTQVVPTGRTLEIGVGDALLGRVVDAHGAALDAGPLLTNARRPIIATAPDALDRPPIATPFFTGVRAIDAMATMGQGQRVCVVGTAGAGKSSLMMQILSEAAFDVAVIGLVGERGREVRNFLEDPALAAVRSRCVTVVATSDTSPLERMHAAHSATAIAEYFRDQGRNVLLIVDSITRFARALREVGLAMGEPPTRRGFPPSVFTELPRLYERAGRTTTGDITAIYTLLVEHDDDDDPIAEETRSLLDGHVTLSAKMARAGRFPAIDILRSRSRLMSAVVDGEHRAASDRVRAALEKYGEIELLLQVGEYRAGNDALADYAVARHEAMTRYFAASGGGRGGLSAVRADLLALVA